MSIINDAIRKARKEFEIKTKPVPIETESLPLPSLRPEASEVKWTAVVVASLVVIASLLGSLFLYKHISGIKRELTPSARTKTPVFFTSSRNKKILPTKRAENSMVLNGIVYGPVDKWAIINDKIAREGNSLQGGTLTLIEKDFVEIVKDNGEELILELR